MSTSVQQDIKAYALKIFRDIWKVKTQHKYLINLDHAEIFGVPTTGDKDYDDAMQNQIETTYQTINKLIEWHKNGIPFSICNMSDASTIYNIVNGYLEAWKYNLSNSINIGNAPTDDLIAMDAFAQEIYPYASTTVKTSNTTVESWITGGNGNLASRNNLSGGGNKVEITERNPIAELFAASMTRRGR